MFICSVRSATLKFVAVISLSLVLLISLAAFIPTYNDISAQAPRISYSGIETNNDRLTFISGFGWTVNEMPVEEAEVKIPEKFDTVYLGYNEIQKAQGLNLLKYRGKDVTRYTYTVTNYEDYEGTVYINLLVFREKIIGGDVCSADSSGFVHGFEKPVSE